jgi:HSP20 family molecular chaperone IbpA
MLIKFAVPAMTEGALEAMVTQEVVAPNTDIMEDDNQTVAVVELPGVEKSDVKVTFERGVLTVTAERKPFEIPEKGRVLMREQTAGAYRRSLRVHHPVEVGNMTAHLADGILRVTLPKAEVAKPRVIEVR